MITDDIILSKIKLVYFIRARYFPYMLGDEDIIQEGIVGLLEAARTYDTSGGATFGWYAGIVIRNHMRAYVWRWYFRPKKFEGEMPLQVSTYTPNTLDLIDLQSWINALPPTQRRRIWMTQIENNTLEDVGKEEGVSTNAVWLGVQRGMVRLRTMASGVS